MINSTSTNKSLNNILRGIDILLKYESNATIEQAGNTDFLCFGSSELEVSEKDKAELQELGWFVDDFYSFRWAYWI